MRRSYMKSGSTKGRRTGVLLAVATALISGVAVFINGYGVRAFNGTADPVTYTTFKNLVAAVVIGVVALGAAKRRAAGRITLPSGVGQWFGLSVVAVIGGALAFALFFEGLSRVSSSQAAFIHKTLIVWVGILAVGLLHEKVTPLHGFALVLLVAGQYLLVGGVADVTFGSGELLMFAATLLWSVEIVVAKRLLSAMSPLTVGFARMGGGVVVLAIYGVVSGGIASIGTVTLTQVGWIALTGLVLSAYVMTWYSALALAPAIDVTAILVGGAVVTALLRTVVAGTPVGSPLGLVFVSLGVGALVVAALGFTRRQIWAARAGT